MISHPLVDVLLFEEEPGHDLVSPSCAHRKGLVEEGQSLRVTLLVPPERCLEIETPALIEDVGIRGSSFGAKSRGFGERFIGSHKIVRHPARISNKEPHVS